MRHPPGSAIGRYRIEALLGAGGMGEVYRAHDTELDRDVALKVVAAQASPEIAERTRREARAASALSHPNVATIFDVGEVGGQPFIVMELIEGRSLRAAMGSASTSGKLAILEQLADALAAAHARGFVHRDVKPDNVMIRADGAAKLLDFGIAKEAERPLDPSAPTEPSGPSLTRTGTSVGSPAYMAPEQIRGQAVDARADQFAWAVTAFEVLTGRLPWPQAGSSYELAASILHGAPAIQGAFADDVPEAMQRAIERALSKDPADRYADMRALLTAARGEAAVTTASPRTESAARAASPRKTPWSAIIGGLVVLGLGGWLLSTLLRPVYDEKSKPKRRAPILGLDDEATKKLDQEIDEPGSAKALGSASAAVSAAPPEPIYPCEDKKAAGCEDRFEPWCDGKGKRVACCAKGLVGTATGSCGCAKGGVTSEELVGSGCERAPEDQAPRVQKKVRADFGKLRACYEAALKRNPKTQGKVSVSFGIGPLGNVYTARVEGSSAPDPDFQDCVVEVFRKIQFEPPADGKMVVTYPLDFSPG